LAKNEKNTGYNLDIFLKEILCILIFGFILFLTGSFLSYSPDDPSINHLTPNTPKNWMGPLGATVADFFMSMLGTAAWLIIPILILLFVAFLKKSASRRPIGLIIPGGILVILSSSLFFALISNSIFNGGIVGNLLAKGTKALMGSGGTLLFTVVTFLIGLVMATPISLIGLLEAFKETLHIDKKKKSQKEITSKAQKEKKQAGEDLEKTPEIKEPLILHSQKTKNEKEKDELNEFQIEPVKGTFALPPLSFLQDPPDEEIVIDKEQYLENSKILEQKLKDFGVSGRVVEICPGPVVTMYEFAPAPGVKINKVASLADDIALALKTRSVRIVAPIPGKAVIGIELANPKRQTVYLKQILSSDAFQKGKGTLLLALGQDIVGQPVVTDLAKMPHLLIAGATGTGKSVGLNSMICSLLYRFDPNSLRILMIDPKRIELSLYDGIPHLIHPVVSEPKEATRALRWAVMEMERRYQLLEDAHTRNIVSYNEKSEEKLPYLIVIIDELADLMMVSSKEVESYIARLAQMARAAGIHIIIATQRPSVDVLTGLIKANFPARISFKVSSKVDSRTILDTMGAERLLGSGDMLFLPPGSSTLERIHGAFISEPEIMKIVEFLKGQSEPDYDFSIVEPSPDEAENASEKSEDFYDEKYDEAVEIVTQTRQASISGLQRRLRIGYNRAARMIEQMEKDGIVTPTDNMGRRQVIVGK